MVKSLKNSSPELLKRVMFIVPRYHTNLVGSVKALKESGHEVLILAAYQDMIEDHSQIKPIILPQSIISRFMVHLFGSGGGDNAYYFPSFLATLNVLIKFRPDLVIVRNPRRIAALYGFAAAKLLGCRVLFYTLSRFDLWSNRSKLLVSWFMSIFSTAWYSPLMVDLDKQFEEEGFFFLPFAVEGRPNGLGMGMPARVLMVGKYRLTRKNHDVFIESIVKVRKKIPVKALIVGEVVDKLGELNFIRLRQKIEKLGASEYINLQRNVDHSLMVNIYADSDLFVLPSSREPAGVSVLEAISNGVPAICSSTCGIRTYIQSGKCGSVFDDGCVDGLTRSILEVISDEDTYIRYSQAAAILSTRFSYQAYINALRHLIKNRW